MVDSSVSASFPIMTYSNDSIKLSLCFFLFFFLAQMTKSIFMILVWISDWFHLNAVFLPVTVAQEQSQDRTTQGLLTRNSLITPLQMTKNN